MVSTVNKAKGSSAQSSLNQDTDFATHSSTSSDSLDFEQLLGGGSYLSSTNSGFSKLHEAMLEIKKESGDELKQFNISLISDPRLSAFGEILLVSASLDKAMYVVAILPGDIKVEREYSTNQNAHLGMAHGDRETVARTIDDIVRQKDKDGNSPFRALVHEKLVNPNDGMKISDVYVANTYPVFSKQEVDAKALLRNIRFDIINYVVARTNITPLLASTLMGKLDKEINVEVTRGMSQKDGLGNPQFSPIVVALSHKVQQEFGGGKSVQRFAEVRGFMEALPISSNRQHAIRVKKANEQGVTIDQITAPRLKPIFMIRAAEWLSNSPGATLEGLIASLGATAFLADSPAWLTASIAEKDSGAYDMASVGYYSPNVEKPAPIGLYHDRKFLADAAGLQGHIQKFWDTVSVAIDVPLSGVGKTVFEALGSTDRINRALRSVYGESAILLTGPAVISNYGSIPVGVYNDGGVTRDTRTVTNAISVATRFGGNIDSINAFMNTFWRWDSNRSDQIFAERLASLKELVGNNELTIRGEDVRLVLSDELIRVLRDNLTRIKTVNANTVVAASDGTAGFGDGWGEGISHGGQAATQGNNAFGGFQTYLS
jgi:hypothetical protein